MSKKASNKKPAETPAAPVPSLDVTLSIPEEDVKALLCCAFEGGVGHWCQVRDYKYAPGLVEDDFRDGGKCQTPGTYWHPCQIIPLVPGCAVVCAEYGDGTRAKLHDLTREKLIEGLRVMATKFPNQFADVISDSTDATTGNVFLQCCLFGDVVYE